MSKLHLTNVRARDRSGEGDAVPAAVAEDAEAAVPGGGSPQVQCQSSTELISDSKIFFAQLSKNLILAPYLRQFQCFKKGFELLTASRASQEPPRLQGEPPRLQGELHGSRLCLRG
jgi:hypothetical protein